MSQNIFNQIQLQKPNKSMFDLTHDVKLSCNMGDLIPVMCVEAVPGDKFNCSIEAVIRALPLVAPPIDRLYVTFHTFFVPWRLLWANWGNWMTNTPIGSPAALPAHPFVNLLQGFPINPLSDYLGLPDPSTVSVASQNEPVSALPFAAYQLIYNEYYRDQNLINPLVQNGEFLLADGDNSAQFQDPGTGAPLALGQMRKRAWMHDYFTSCLPFAQKGQAVTIPVSITEDAAVFFNNTTPAFTTLTGAPININVESQLSTTGTGIQPDALFADTSSFGALSSTINDLRLAEALQKWLEAAARGGSRPSEWILNMYGVRTSDARLQRPEYITGTKQAMMFSEVLNTTGTSDAPQGDMAGHGISALSGNYSGYFCEEFGYIITMMNIQPATTYFQGINRMWSKFTDPSQLINPKFAHLGEQAIPLKELYAYTDNHNDTFGYLPIFAEARFQPNRVAGQMRTTLNHWHWARNFATEPALNQTFIEADPSYRTFAVVDPLEDHFVGHILNKISAVRPLPKYGTPSII